MKTKQKVLLMLLPFHPPLIPPLGIACLKAYLQANGFYVKAVNGNRNDELSDFYNQYMDALKSYIPPDRQANFYNIGNEVLRNHMMAFVNRGPEDLYNELVRVLVYNTFFLDITPDNVAQLNKIVTAYFAALEKFVLRTVAREKPAVFGLSVFKGTLPSSMFAFDVVKKAEPGILTVMGGGVFADQLSVGSPDLQVFVERTPYIDKIVLGEGEELFLKLLRGQLPENQKVFSRKDFEAHFVDVSHMPLPDFSDFDVDYYPYLANYSSRSCPFQCTFCGETVLWGRYRKKKPEQIVEEMAQLRTLYNRRNFLLCDSLLNPTVEGLSSGLRQRGETVFFDGYLRVDPAVCDVKNTVRWRCGGFYRARLGVESGSPRVLELMDKKITTRQIRQAVSSLAYAGIKTTTYWIVGYPGETEEDFQMTLDLITELKDDIYEAEANPFWYFPNALVKSDEWSKHSVNLFPDEMTDMLLMPTRVLELDPTPRERYLRLNRFVRHCKDLGLPNPYSLADIYQADERWKKLHRNAVPALTDFYSGGQLTAFRPMKRHTEPPAELSLSDAQQLRSNGNGPRYERLAAELEGTVDPDMLRRAMAATVKRHAILGGDSPFVHRRGGDSAGNGRLALYGELFRELERDLELENGPALATMLYDWEPGPSLLLLTGKAANLDRESAGLLLKELFREYNRLAAGNGEETVEPPLQYRDYAEWNRERLAAGELDHQKAFWQRTLKSATIREYIAAKGGSNGAPDNGGLFRLNVPPDLLTDLQTMAKSEGTDVFTVLFAMLGAWLSSQGSQPDVVVGTEFDIRVYPEQQEIAGPMTNLVPVALQLSGNPVFRQVLRRAQDALALADRNRDFPVDRVWREQGYTVSNLPVVLRRQQPRPEALRIDRLSVRGLGQWELLDSVAPQDDGLLDFPGHCGHDLDLDLWDDGHKAVLYARFNRGKFNVAGIRDLLEDFLAFGRQLAANPDAHLSQVDATEESLMDELF